MAKYQWQGNVLTVDFAEDKAGLAPLSLDLDKLAKPVLDSITKMGARTIARNATAGKMDDPDEAHKAMAARFELFQKGIYASEGKVAVKITLTQEEKDGIILGLLIKAKRSQPNEKRTDAEIAKAFNALPDEKKLAALASLQKLIDKALKTALAEKKKLAKAGGWAEPEAEAEGEAEGEGEGTDE